MKRAVLSLAAVAMLALAVAAGTWIYLTHELARPGPLAEASVIVIPRGERTLAIGGQLEAMGAIRSRYAFAAGTQLGVKAPIKAGEYEIPATSSIDGIVALLRSGKVVVHHLTVPEGLTVKQVAALVNSDATLTGDIGPLPVEGSLWPDTYRFVLGETRAALLRMMQSKAARQLEASWAARDAAVPLPSAHDALVLASIVEKETGVPAERAHVASVFENRLHAGMKLQSDPTVIYAESAGEGLLPRPLTHEDLARPSAYNTYVIAGLPPQPICNPGKAAIEAVLHPALSKDMYFVATGTGGHAFAETVELHNRNVAAYLKALRDQRKASGK